MHKHYLKVQKTQCESIEKSESLKTKRSQPKLAKFSSVGTKGCRFVASFNFVRDRPFYLKGAMEYKVRMMILLKFP